MENSAEPPEAIAIVGMACKLPGALNPEELWDLVANGKVAIRELSLEEQAAGRPSLADESGGRYVPSAGTIADFDTFDAGFFGIGPRDAALMDPQHRKFMECVWAALEDAAIVPSRFTGSIGLYAGSGMNAYLINNLLTNPDILERMGMFLLRHTSNDKDFLTTAISYRLNLTGPSVNVQTACSTSLVAVHMASQALLAGECDVALAGGVTIEVPHAAGYMYREGEVLAPDGVCRAFDKQSSGTVLSSGVGAVVLRRLGDAIRDGDRVHAVIRGTAINNDGAGKVGYLAPSVDGHARVVREALAVSDISAETIQLLEAHGTGTAVGDPIEVAALSDAFRRDTDRTQFCRLVSTKPNVGHTDTAAGVTSLIKVVQALKHQVLPPMANYESPNPLIDFESSPFYVSSSSAPWRTDGETPRRAGVSALGVGGTNAHVLVEEAPSTQLRSPDSHPSRPCIVPLSAKSPAALVRAMAELAKYIERKSDTGIADIAATYQLGREQFPFRRALVVRNTGELSRALVHEDSRSPGEVSKRPRLAFLFPGGGTQYPNMGRDLYQSEPVFRAAIDRCDSILRQQFEFDLRGLLYDAKESQNSQKELELQKTANSLITVFSVEYALAQLLASWQIRPDAVLGHSLGEYTAACISGVLSLEDAIRLVVTRGQLIDCVPEGAMLSVALTEEELRRILPTSLDIAVVNAAELCVVTGPAPSIEEFSTGLTDSGIEWRRINIKAPGHSAMLDPILDRFGAVAAQASFGKMEIPFLSNTTGGWVADGEASTPDYWVRHLRQPVRFADNLRALLATGDTVVLEVGPGRTLSGLAMASETPPVRAVNAMRRASETTSDQEQLLGAVGQIWESGVEISWSALGGTGRRISLPTYPFERDRHWIRPGTGARGSKNLSEATDLGEWLWRPSWMRAERVKQEVLIDGTWLVLGLDDTRVLSWTETIVRAGASAISVVGSATFSRKTDTSYAVNVDSEQAVGMLFADLAARNVHLDHVLFLSASPRAQSHTRRLTALLRILRGLHERNLMSGVSVGVLTEGAFSVTGAGAIASNEVALAGAVRVAATEFPEATLRFLDVETGLGNRSGVLAELRASKAEPVVAIRNGFRWLPAFLSNAGDQGAARLRHGGVYMITGGTSGLGLALAEHLVGELKAKVILLSRTPFPQRPDWQAWAETDGPTAPMAAAIRAMLAMDRMGGTVRTLACDVADVEQLRSEIANLEAELGPINGVFHAAGVLDDALIASRADSETIRVLRPKVDGVDALVEVFGNSQLDFMLLFSSVSAYAGVSGQADYAFANAYMDAVADGSRLAFPVFSVQWSAWGESGTLAGLDNPGSALDADSADANAGAPAPWDGTSGRLIAQDQNYALSLTRVAFDDWVVSEHRTASGLTPVPGSALLAIMAHLAERFVGSPHLANVEFSSALLVGDADARIVRAIAVRGDSATRLSVASFDSTATRWMEHATAFALKSNDVAPVVAPESLVAEVLPEPAATQPDAMEFGPRWHSIRAFGAADSFVRGEIALEACFEVSDGCMPIHPALLDLATGLALMHERFTGERGLFVPARYGTAQFFKPFPTRFSVSAKVTSPLTDPVTSAIFDVDVVDQAGEIAAAFRDVVFAAVDRSNNLGETAAAPNWQVRGRSAAAERFGGGIRTNAGMKVLERILSLSQGGTIVASPYPANRIPELLRPNDGASAPPTEGVERELSGYVPPDSSTERYLASQWQSLLGLRQISTDENFFDLGGQSLLALRLAGAVRRDLGVHMPLALLLEAPTIRQLAAALVPELERDPTTSASNSSQQWRNLVAINPGGNRQPLFCIHGMNGNVLNFREISAELGPDQPFYGIQATGLNEGDAPHRTIEEMAEVYITELRTVQNNGPYNLAGYSGGGLIAFEMARQLRAAGDSVSFLAMLDTFTPEFLLKSRLQRVRGFLRGLKEGRRSFVETWLATNRLAKFSPREESLAASTGKVGDAFVRAQGQYQLSPMDQSVTLLRAAERSERGYVPPDLGWRKFAKGGVEVWDIPGGHETMCIRPNVAALAACLRAGMTRTSR